MPNTTDMDSTLPRAAPRSPGELFAGFAVIALQGFGGAFAVVQRELVENRRWLNNDEFLEDWAVAQVMPGPNVVNLSLIVGGRYFGVPGSAAAVAGLTAIPLVLVLMLGFLYNQFSGIDEVAGAIRGISAITAGIIIATSLKLSTGLARNVLGITLGLAFASGAFILVALLRWSVLSALLGLGLVACMLAWRRLKE